MSVRRRSTINALQNNNYINNSNDNYRGRLSEAEAEADAATLLNANLIPNLKAERKRKEIWPPPPRSWSWSCSWRPRAQKALKMGGVSRSADPKEDSHAMNSELKRRRRRPQFSG